MITDTMEIREKQANEEYFRQLTEIVFQTSVPEKPELADVLSKYERQERSMALLLLGW